MVMSHIAWRACGERQDSKSRALKLASIEHYKQGIKSFVFCVGKWNAMVCDCWGSRGERWVSFGAQTPVTPELWLKREKKHIYIAQYFYGLNSLSSTIGHMDKPKQRRNAYFFFFVYGVPPEHLTGDLGAQRAAKTLHHRPPLWPPVSTSSRSTGPLWASPRLSPWEGHPYMTVSMRMNRTLWGRVAGRFCLVPAFTINCWESFL